MMDRRCLLLVGLLSAGWVQADPVTAEDDPDAQLALIRQAEGQYAPRAVGPLTQLGERAAQAGRHREAIDLLKQAQHILHRHYGVNTPEQLDLVTLMVMSYLELADVESADNLMAFRLAIQRANFGRHDLRIVPVILDLAGWHQARARFDDARQLYLEALDVLQAADVDGRPMQRTLNLLSFTEYLQGRCCDIEVVEAAVAQTLADESLDFADRARALISAGDMLIMAGTPERAAELYAAAGDMQSTTTTPVWLGISRSDRMMRAYEALTNRNGLVSPMDRYERPPPGMLVGAPLAFCASQLDKLVRSRLDYRDFEIDLAFSVDESGRPRQIRVVESNAPGAVDVLAMRVLRTSRFRPVFHDGELIDAPMRITQRFDEPVNLSGNSPFPPANTAVFHACQGLALQ